LRVWGVGGVIVGLKKRAHCGDDPPMITCLPGSSRHLIAGIPRS